jgi:hypothetical protein
MQKQPKKGADSKTPKSFPDVSKENINHPLAGTPSGTSNESMLSASHRERKGRPAGTRPDGNKN